MSNLHFSRGNRSLPCTDEYEVVIFNLPAVALREDGRIICCEAPERCKKVCYAKRDQRYPNVYKNRKENYEISLTDDFVELVQAYIDEVIKELEDVDKQIVVRIHESGDFYSRDYLDKWVQIANHYKANEKILFMAYTKSITILKGYLDEKGIDLKDTHIKLRFSIMKSDDDENNNTSSEKIDIAESLRTQGLRYYTLLKSGDDLPKGDNIDSCILNIKENKTCADCEMKCYFDDKDIVAFERR